GPAARIATPSPPAPEREQENRDGQEQRPVAAYGGSRAGGSRGCNDDTLIPAHDDRQAFVIAERVWHRDADHVAISRNARIACARPVSPVERDRTDAGSTRRQLDFGCGHLDRHFPLIAGHVPVQLVVLVEEAQAVDRTIAEDDRAIRVGGARDPDLVLDVVPLPAGLRAQILSR